MGLFNYGLSPCGVILQCVGCFINMSKSCFNLTKNIMVIDIFQFSGKRWRERVWIINIT